MRRVSLSPQRKPVWCGAPGAGCATLMCSCCLSGRPGEDGCRPNGFGEDLEHGRGIQGILWAVPTDDAQGGSKTRLFQPHNTGHFFHNRSDRSYVEPSKSSGNSANLKSWCLMNNRKTPVPCTAGFTKTPGTFLAQNLRCLWEVGYAKPQGHFPSRIRKESCSVKA